MQTATLGILLIAGFAVLFHYVGNNDYYKKGWLLAIVSLLVSFGGSVAGFLGIFGANLLLYVVLLVYNLFRKKPPGSGSGW
jgi:uncharacterized membrane protein